MAQRIEGLSIGLDLDALALDRGLTGVKDRLRTVNSEMRLNMSAFDRGDRSISKYETRLDGLNKKLDVQKKATEEAYKEYQKMVQEHGEGSREAEKAERAYNNQAASLNNLERYVENATKELEEMRKEQAFQESAWGKATTNLESFSDKAGKIGDSLTDFGKTMSTRVTAPLLAAGGVAFAAADQIDKAYRELRVGTGATGEALDELEESFDKVFKSVPDGSEQVASSMATLNTFTGATNETLEGLTVSLLDVSRLLGEDAAQNSQTFGEALQQWQRPAEEGTEILDYMFTLTQEYGVGLGELNGQLTRHGSVLNNAGFEMEEAAHFMAGLEKNGIQVSRVMPGLNQAFRNWADEGKNSREELERVVETIAETEDKQEALSLATEVFGSQGAQRLMTAIRNRAIPAFEDLGSGADDASGSIQETAEETRTIGEEFQILKNNTMQSLQPVGEVLLDLARRHIPPLVDGVQDLAEWFDDLDESTQRNIIAIAGVTAATGPASVALGGMFNVVSTLSGGLAKVTGIIGRAGGAGVAGRLGLLGATGGAPVALAIAGVAALAGGIYYLSNRKDELHDISLDTTNSLWEQADSLENLVTEYEELEAKSKLTKEEFGRLLDVQKELEQTQNPGKIAELKDEYEELADKSGLSKDEINELIEANNGIIEQSPDVEKSFTDKGNAIVESTDAVNDYIQSLRDMAWEELEIERVKALENEEELRRRNKELNEEIAQTEEDIQELMALRDVPMSDIEARLEEINRKMDSGLVGEEEYIELGKERGLLQKVYNGGLVEGLETLQDQKSELQDKVDKNDEEIAKLEEINIQMADMLLQEVDINYEKGEGLTKLDEQIDKLKDQRREMVENTSEEMKKSSEYDEQLGLLDEAINKHEGIRDRIYEETGYQSESNARKERAIELLDIQEGNLNRIGQSILDNNTGIDDGTGKAADMNRELGKDVSKTIGLDASPSIDEFNRSIGSSILKRVNLTVAGGAGGAMLGAYATGTDNHPGGPFIAGEAGWELGRMGNNWEVLNAGLYDRPAGYQVFTHSESKRIISALNSLPAYADGISYENEPTQTMRMIAAAGRNIINREQTEPQSGNVYYQPSSDNSDIIVLLQELIVAVREGKNIVMNDREVGRIIEPHITETQDRNKRVRDNFA
ncbi:phage tail tape measure protein [Virgibacillus kimchii]